MRRTVLLAIVVGLVAASAVLADGGKDIAAAPVVTIGKQLAGSTATGGKTPDSSCFDYDSFWALPVTAGDRVVVDWEAVAGTQLLVYAVGTTDFNVGKRQPLLTWHLSANNKDEGVMTAPKTGSMPLAFHDEYDCDASDAGPYSFTARVKHKLVVTFAVDTNRTEKHATFFKVGVFDGDGHAVSGPKLTLDVQVKTAGKFATTGSFALSDFRQPWAKASRGKKFTLRVRVRGTAYRTATSKPVIVTAK